MCVESFRFSSSIEFLLVVIHAELQQRQQNSRFHSDGFLLSLWFFFGCCLVELDDEVEDELMLLSAILLRRKEHLNNNPPRSVDPLDCDNRQFSRMEFSRRLPVRDRPDEEAAVNLRKSSLLDRAATMASSKTSFKLR